MFSEKAGYSAILLRIFTDYSIFGHINALVKEIIGYIMNNMKQKVTGKGEDENVKNKN